MHAMLRSVATLFALALLTLCGGCELLSWFVLFDSLRPNQANAVPQDGEPQRLSFSYVATMQLTGCAQSEQDSRTTVRCDFVFPDGTSIRSELQAYAPSGGNAVVHRYAPLVLQVPAGAGYWRGSFDDGAGFSGNLLITSGLSSLPLDTTSMLRAEPGTELVILDFPAPPPAVSAPMQLRLSYRASSTDVKVMAVGKFDIGARTYYPPLLPCASSFGQVAPLAANVIPTGEAIATMVQPCNGTLYNFLGNDDPGPHPWTLVEYYNVGLDHYFITGVPSEIAALDAGTTLRGWARTGLTFNVWRQPGNGTSPVCRYYLPPAYGDSHFFGRGLEECRTTGDRNPAFVLEQTDFMHVWLPTLGNCPPGTKPIYRLFSNRADANHRYTTDRVVRDEMVGRGWIAEGDGPDQVAMCGLA